MTRNLAKIAKKKILFAEFYTYGQTKVEISENRTYPQTPLFSNNAIKSRLWIFQIVFSTITGLPIQSILF
jgi:hypothetical protein